MKKIEHEIELKWIDDPIDYFHCTNTPTLGGSFVAMVKGDNPSNRTADMITTTSAHIRMIMVQDSLSLTATNVRICFFWDRQCNSALPAWGDVFDVASVPGGAGNTLPTVAAYNRDNSKRFKILYDKTYTLYPQGYDGTNYLPMCKYINKKIRLGRDVKYLSTSNTGTTTDITTNNLLMFMFSDVPFANTHAPQLAYNVRVYFKDP